MAVSSIPGKSIGSGFSLSGETFRSPYQIGVRQGPADDGKRLLGGGRCA